MTAQLAYPVQCQPFTLSGSGSSIGDTVLNLKSFKDILGVNLAMASFGTVGYGTTEPGNGTQEEQISFSGVTQNSDGTAQLTGVKHVLFISPFTESSGMTITHPGSTTFVISNTSAFENSLYALLQTTVASGGLPASSTQIGITKLSVNPTVLANPIAVGDNDNRVPSVNASSITAGQLAALFGTIATASASNKYVTNNDTSITPASGAVIRALGTGLVSASYIPVGVASGQIIQANATGLPVIDGSNLTNLKFVASFVGTPFNSGSVITTTNVDTAYTPNFTAKNITIYYALQGVNSGTTQFSYGIATYNGASVVANYILKGNLATNTLSSAVPSVGSSNPVAGVVPGTNCMLVTLSVTSITSTQFTVRAAFNQDSANAGIAQFYVTATQ